MNSLLRRILCIVLLLSGFTELPGSSDASEGGSITIYGVVRRPGTYEISGPIAIMKAIKLAGSIPYAPYDLGAGNQPSPAASRTRVERGNSVFRVNLGRSRTPEDEAFIILPGDRIGVPEWIF